MSTAQPGQPTPKAEKDRGRRRRLVGRVVNETRTDGRAQQTVVVEVIRRARDPFYGKYVKRKKKFHAHDEANWTVGEWSKARHFQFFFKSKFWR